MRLENNQTPDTSSTVDQGQNAVDFWHSDQHSGGPGGPDQTPPDDPELLARVYQGISSGIHTA